MKYSLKILPTGLKIITILLTDTPTVTVLVMVEAGSKYETKEINGLSHFLEHMCFKGTEKRPTAFSISRELDSLGAQSNAFTSQEFTGYYAKSHKKHLEKLLDVISDIYLNQKFDEKEIDKEKGVVIEEIHMYQDLPQKHVFDIFSSLLYGDQPAGWPITGPKENIKSLSREDFLRYRNAHYVAEATTVIVSGSIDQAFVEEQVEKLFSSISTKEKGIKLSVIEKQESPKILIEGKATDQTHLVLGVRTYPVGHKNMPALKVMSAILGGGMSSRLFQKLREEMGVTYYVRAESDLYTDHGYLAISAGVPKDRVVEVVHAIVSELTRFIKEPVSSSELEKVKDYLIGTMYLELESSDALAEFYGYQSVLAQPLKTPDEFAEKIKAVTAEDISIVAQEIFTDSKLNLAIVGDIKKSQPLKDALSFQS
ncbi:MAG: pitrilysin family protein [Patescibacteria group bacterium]